MQETTDAATAPSLEGAYDDAGVDLTLVRWMLGLTPRERLAVLEGQLAFYEMARHARRKEPGL